MTSMPQKARIIASYGRHYLAEKNGELIQCVARGKRNLAAVGDIVTITPTAKGQAVIDSIAIRDSLFFRSDQFKSKFLASNVTQLFIILATEPHFSDDLISRALIAAESIPIPVCLILNKIDVKALLLKARERLQLYTSIGYPLYEVSATTEPEMTLKTLEPLIKNKTTLLIGQSGMGKSSIINTLIPEVDIATQEISTALNSGKHTTTFTRLYQMNENTALIDSPGFQEFGLFHLKKEVLEKSFLEFRPYLGKCRFHNCNHLTEPDCAVLQAIEKGIVSSMRHQLYAQLLHESSQKRY